MSVHARTYIHTANPGLLSTHRATRDTTTTQGVANISTTHPLCGWNSEFFTHTLPTNSLVPSGTDGWGVKMGGESRSQVSSSLLQGSWNQTHSQDSPTTTEILHSGAQEIPTLHMDPWPTLSQEARDEVGAEEWFRLFLASHPVSKFPEIS